MSKRRVTEYASAIRDAERDTRFFVANEVKYTGPYFRSEMDKRISELQLAWRDMTEEEKAEMKAETIRKAKYFLREKAKPLPSDHPSQTYIEAANRFDQIDALYRAMTDEQRSEYDGRRAP